MRYDLGIHLYQTGKLLGIYGLDRLYIQPTYMTIQQKYRTLASDTITAYVYLESKMEKQGTDLVHYGNFIIDMHHAMNATRWKVRPDKAFEFLSEMFVFFDPFTLYPDVLATPDVVKILRWAMSKNTGTLQMNLVRNEVKSLKYIGVNPESIYRWIRSYAYDLDYRIEFENIEDLIKQAETGSLSIMFIKNDYNPNKQIIKWEVK